MKYHNKTVYARDNSIAVFTIDSNSREVEPHYIAKWVKGHGSRRWAENQIDERLAFWSWRFATKLEHYLYGVEHETET